MKLTLDDQTLTLDHVHPVQIGKILSQYFPGNTDLVKRSGSISLQTKNFKQFNDVMNLSQPICVNVSANNSQSPRNIKILEVRSKNECKGVVSEESWKTMNEVEIKTEINAEYRKEKGLKDANLVKDVYQITKTISTTEKQKTRTFIITFDSCVVPKEVKLGGMVFKVREYRPKPLTCSKCLKLGHIKAKCNSNVEICWKCGHEKEDCHACSMEKCPNCPTGLNDHKPNGNTCPAMDLENLIIDLRMKRKLSYFEAKNEVIKWIQRKNTSNTTQTSYSQIVTNESEMINLQNELAKEQQKLDEVKKLRVKLESVRNELKFELLKVKQMEENNHKLQQQLNDLKVTKENPENVDQVMLNMELDEARAKRRTIDADINKNPQKVQKITSETQTEAFKANYSVEKLHQERPINSTPLTPMEKANITKMVSKESLHEYSKIILETANLDIKWYKLHGKLIPVHNHYISDSD